MVSLHEIAAMEDDNTVIVAGAPIPELLAVEAIGEFRLRVTWTRDGGEPETEEIDVGPAIFSDRSLVSLRENPDLFAQVEVSEDACLVWPNGSEMDSHWLDVMPRKEMTNEEFRQIMDSLGYSLDGAAHALGIARRNVASYRKDKPLPPLVALATREVERQANDQPKQKRGGFVARSQLVDQGKSDKLHNSAVVKRDGASGRFDTHPSSTGKGRRGKPGKIA